MFEQGHNGLVVSPRGSIPGDPVCNCWQCGQLIAFVKLVLHGDLIGEQAYDFLLAWAIRVPFCFINWV